MAEPTVHDLKTWPEYFERVADRTKRFDVRLDDRHFQEGDTVRLLEYDPESGTYSGRAMTARVGYVLRGGCAAVPDMTGHVVFSLLDAAGPFDAATPGS